MDPNIKTAIIKIISDVVSEKSSSDCFVRETKTGTYYFFELLTFEDTPDIILDTLNEHLGIYFKSLGIKAGMNQPNTWDMFVSSTGDDTGYFCISINK